MGKIMNSMPQRLPTTELSNHTPDSWQHFLSNTLDTPEALLTYLELPQTLLMGAQTADQLFALKAPRPFVDKIEKGNPDDPLLLQILPQLAESTAVEGFVDDPLAERDANLHQGLIHKYKGRVLLILSGACAINCRYCFRRHFPYTDNRLGSQQWQQVLQYLQADSSIKEVIFSGGDPLATSDSRLQKMITDLEQIPHISRLRIHSRLPIVIPQRITQGLSDMLARTRLNTIMVLHANHANELDQQTATAVQRLKQANVHVLNQAVLLKGINDQVPSLVQLSEKLFSIGILPYYLFTLDPVKGAAHFDIPDAQAIQLHQALQTELPGFLVPKLAREIPDRPSKTLLHPTFT